MDTYEGLPNGQSWVARCQFEGRKPFILGTVHCLKTANMDDVASAIYALFTSMMPLSTPMPKIINMIPGCLVFIEDKSR